MLILVVAVAAAAALCWWFVKSKGAKKEFEGLLSPTGTSHIASITFSGQQRSITVTDHEVLSALEDAMRNRTPDSRTGLTYEVSIEFSSGAKANTAVYVHDDKEGLTVANDYNKSAGDPEYIGVRFRKPMSAKLHALMDSLTK